MMGTPGKGDKTNNSFNSTMMASFLPVIARKKTNKQRKYVFYLSQIHINPKKTQKKIKMTVSAFSLNVPTWYKVSTYTLCCK